MRSPLSAWVLVQHKASMTWARSNGASTLPAKDYAAALRSLYLEFLDSLSISNSSESCNPQVDVIRSRIAALCPSIPAKVITHSAAIAEIPYRYHPLEIQVKIAHFNALVMYVDDLSGSLKGDARERFLQDLSLFHIKFSDPEGYSRLYPGRGDLHPICEDTIIFLKSDLSPFLASDIRLHSLMVKSVLDFFEANMLEQHYEEHPLDLTTSPAVRLLPGYIRRKSGIAEPYAHFVIMNTSSSFSRTKDEEHFFYNKLYPMIPELVDAIEYINDVLSFYKELKDGELGGILFDDAKVHGISPMEALAVYAQYVVDIRKRIVAFVETADSPEMRKKVVQFFQGFVSWHLGSSRYRLYEVLPAGWYKGELYA